MRASFTHSDPYCRLEEEPSLRILRYTREDVPYPSLEELERNFAAVNLALDKLGRESYALLVDLRSVRGSNEPAFEAAMKRARNSLFRGFRKVAVLVMTSTGALQMRRHAEEDRMGMRVYSVEKDALSFLRVETRLG